MPLRNRRLWLAGLALPLAAVVAACSSDALSTLDDGARSRNRDGSDVDPSKQGDTSGQEPEGTVGLSANSSKDGGADAGKKPGGASSPTDFACPGSTIKPGLNSDFMVNGKARSLIAEFPTKTDQPMAVIFSWHGYQQDTEQFRKDMQLNPNQDPAVPAIIITPDDTNILPPSGLDWKIVNPEPGQVNIDLAFFEAMVGCLNAQQKIDPTRIYSVGFSAGSVMTSLLHSEYPKLVTAIVNVSGAWMNDKAETSKISFPLNGIEWHWPALDPADKGNVLLTHGGSNDVTVANIMDLEKSAQAAFPFLKANQRTVIDCAHNNGHTGHPDVTAAVIAKYLYAHRAGQPSPYANGNIAGFPNSCTLRLP